MCWLRWAHCGGSLAFQNACYVRSGENVGLDYAWPVTHQPANLDEFAPLVNRWPSTVRGLLDDFFSVIVEKRIRRNEEPIDICLLARKSQVERYSRLPRRR